jgi:predicted AAA+ superfamily ATPase
MIRRICKLPINNSFFLFGPRQTGKTTLIEGFVAGRRVWVINLLDRTVYHRYLASPGQFYAEAKKKITDEQIEILFIDEVQKIPALLDEVQRLMHEQPATVFILSGSSARKLKREGANLLGGRAVSRNLSPLTHHELGECASLDDILQFGSLPSIILKPSTEERVDLLTAYVTTYLSEEIQQESLVRNLPGFLNFLEVAAQQSGELLNFSNVARDAQLQPRTVQSYYDILVDTLIGIKLQAYSKSVRRRLRSTPKFYLFDLGVLNTLERQLRSTPDKVRRGRLFEHFIVLETDRLLRYLSTDGRAFFWRTKDGQEVDLLIEDRGVLIAAVEIKSSSVITPQYFSGLRAFADEHPSVPRYVVADVPEGFELQDLATVLPWREYLMLLDRWLRK